MSAFSGKNGSVEISGTAIAEITGWTFNPTSNNPSWASSSNAGYKQRVAGVKDGSGSIDFKYQDTTEFAKIAAGTSLTLTLKMDTGSTNQYSVPAYIDGVSLEVDINDGEVVGGSADFSTNGTWTEPS